jgi:pimeloyl-ACP methyl ester carboxylesterase
MKSTTIPAVSLPEQQQHRSPYNQTCPISRKNKPAWLRFVIATLILTVIATLIFHGYIAWKLARPVIESLQSNPKEAIGVEYIDVRFASAEGDTELSGWYIPANSAKTVIFSHGYGGNREEHWVPIYDLAKALHNENYNVLMFDYAYASPDSSQASTGGFKESKQLLGAVDFVKNNGAQQVFIWGFSMGAGTALQAALQYEEIQGMILDSTFVLDPDTLYQNIKLQIDLPRFPSLHLIGTMIPYINGAGLERIPYDDVKSKQYSMPIFMIHGKKDKKAPYAIAKQIFHNQMNALSQLWLLPKRGHEMIYRHHPDEYIERALGFLNDAASTNK